MRSAWGRPNGAIPTRDHAPERHRAPAIAVQIQQPLVAGGSPVLGRPRWCRCYRPSSASPAPPALTSSFFLRFTKPACTVSPRTRRYRSAEVARAVWMPQLASCV